MQLKKDKTLLQDFKEAIHHEWLETNGLGGWASSSIIGCNTRRYHGLLVAALPTYAERMALVSKLEETITINNEQFDLGVNNYGGVIHPDGNQHQVSFTKDFFPQFIYDVGGVVLKKTITMVHGENTTVIIYNVLDAQQPFTLELLPLLSVRRYHGLIRANNEVLRDAHFSNDVFSTQVYDDTPGIFIKVPHSEYHHDPNWWFHFNYDMEKEREFDFVEDLFAPGEFSVSLQKGDSLGIIISTDDPSDKDAAELFAKESLRRRLLTSDLPEDDVVKQLVLAADQFIIEKKTQPFSLDPGDEEAPGRVTIIAGYHWFTDWTRDAMIALPGLCLSTGRYEDAKRILWGFAKSVSDGMLPNHFPDNGEPIGYNNVDGTLWYFIAIYKYLEATNDKEFVLGKLLPVLREIIEWHFRGTRHGIRADEDGLLYSGEQGLQLTWMDAKIGEWVVTPRMGKAVEINALWCNALSIYATLLEMSGNSDEATTIFEKAALARKSFNEQFWNSEAGYLYDVVNDNEKDDSLRPNQLLAISLPFILIDREKSRSILKIITAKLYALTGLRTLSPDDPLYASCYDGDAHKRDSCYHQGTVWSWLLGPYIDALAKLGTSRSLLKNVIDNFAYHLNEGCIGNVSEIFDAEFPHRPKGCIAQAWGVAEILRVINDYDLIGEEETIAETEEKKMEKGDDVTINISAQ
ncbi:MAG TPA: amylo-alpha-1,6-glucosidase [Chitinophagaceae bacterium]|nr:amylo-alpha-1,6-glucosidase [Chitinophagaceae bacterium]